MDGSPDISNGFIWKAILTGECESVMGESTFLLSLMENWETCLEDRETLRDVLSSSLEDETMGTSSMPADFVNLLCHQSHGPKLDAVTGYMLSHFFGVHDGESFLQFSRKSFPGMLHPLTEHEL